MNDRQWEIFESDAAETRGRSIRVTLSARGVFYLNRKALIALGEPDAVMMMFDRTRAAIGIVRVPIDRRGSYRLKRKYGDISHARTVHAAKFCRAFNLLPPGTISFKDPTVTNDGVLILEMTATAAVRGKNYQ